MSATPRLRAIDLNLLPILRQLLIERNVTRAAETLALSQPTVSKALARLRAIFDDPLLIRHGRGMMLTPRAERLLPEIEEQCLGLESLWRAEEFDPRSTRRDFKILATDYEALVVLPEIALTLQQEAPLISLSFCEMQTDSVPDSWTNVDLVIGPEEVLASALEPEAVRIPLLHEDYVMVVPPSPSVDAASHEGRRRPLIFSPGAGLPGATTKMQALLPSSPLATLPSFTSLPILTLLTGAAALVPRMVAARFATYLPITVLESGEPTLAVDIHMAWHRRWDNDPGHRWLRDLIVARCTQR